MFFRLLSLGLALASPGLAESYTFSSAQAHALAHNPDLQAARLALTQAEARIAGAGRLPNPELESELSSGRRDRGRFQIGLSQEFPRTARLQAERQIAALDLQLARDEITVAENRLLARTDEAVLQLALRQQRLLLAQAHTHRLQAFAEAQRAGHRSGHASALDAESAEFHALQASQQELEADEARQEAATELQLLLGLASSAHLGADVALELPPALPTLPSFAPPAELLLADTAVAVADRQVSLARTAGRENYRLGAFVEGEREPGDLGGRQDSWQLGVRVSVPLDLRKASAPAVNEKLSDLRRRQAERDALRSSLTLTFEAGARRVTAQWRLAQSLRERLLPAARQQLQSCEEAYARGEASLEQILHAQARLADVEHEALTANHSFLLALRQLHAAAGLHRLR